MTELENAVFQIFKSQAPTRKGILKGSIRVERVENGFNIVSDIYYMPYTEEAWVNVQVMAWKSKPKRRDWFKEAFEMALRFISSAQLRLQNLETFG